MQNHRITSYNVCYTKLLRDYLVIHDSGAHGFAMGYNYNGKLRSAEVLLKEDGTTELIRRAETPADYFATFDFSDLFSDEKYNVKGKIV